MLARAGWAIIAPGQRAEPGASHAWSPGHAALRRLRLLAAAHVLVGLLLVLASLMGGAVLVPLPLLLRPPLIVLPLAAVVWVLVMGARLWFPAPGLASRLRWTRIIAMISLVVAGLLGAGGLMGMRADQLRAAAGGGLLGGLWLYPLSLGVTLATVAAASLFLASRIAVQE